MTHLHSSSDQPDLESQKPKHSRNPKVWRGVRRQVHKPKKQAKLFNRAPPLPIIPNTEVTVVNGDRSNLTWRSYTLLDIDERTNLCTVIGSDFRPCTFPRAVVKPKDWIDKLLAFYTILERGNEVEFYNFAVGLQLLGAHYPDKAAINIFKELDTNSTGCLSFQQFINWIYGLGRHPDRGKLLTTIECICDAREWSLNLPFYIMKQEFEYSRSINEQQNHRDSLGRHKHKINKWHNAKITNQSLHSNEPYVCLQWKSPKKHNESLDQKTDILEHETKNQEEIALTLHQDGQHIAPDGDDDEQLNHGNNTFENLVRISRTTDEFRKEFNNRLDAKTLKCDNRYRPVYRDHENLCRICVMGASQSGKSAILNKFVKGIFPYEHDPTIKDIFKKEFMVDEEKATLEIIDTAGQQEFASFRYDWLSEGIDVLILTFTRASYETFQECKALLEIANRLLREKIYDRKTRDYRIQKRKVPIIIASTKSDLLPEEQEVDEHGIEELKASLRGINVLYKYVECSAFLDDTNENRVNRIFIEAVKLFRQAKKQKCAQLHLEEEIPELKREDTHAPIDVPKLTCKLRCQNCCSSLTLNFMLMLIKCTEPCPNLQKYFELEDGNAHSGGRRRLLYIGQVSKDQYVADISRPVFSVQHFMVRRAFKPWVFIGGIIMSIIFPIILALQTLIFFLYNFSFFNYFCICKNMSCWNKLIKLLPEDWDYGDGQYAIAFDFLDPIVGRDPRDESLSNDVRKWFLSQTWSQILARLTMGALIVFMCLFAFYNALQRYVIQGAWKVYTDPDYDDEDRTLSIAVMEYLGPVVLWFATWFIVSVYMALESTIVPQLPSITKLRPFVLYLGNEESIRTTAYVFLRGFVKSTLEMYRLEATWDRILISLIVSIIYSLIPGVTRSWFIGEPFWTKEDPLETIAAFIINLMLSFALALGLQMQLLSGLQNYVEWMDDVTSLLDPKFSNERGLPYLRMVRQSNALSWIEMRTYLFTKGLIIFSRQEIFITSLILMAIGTASYLLYRLLTDDSKFYKNETFLGILFVFLVVCYSLLRLLRTVRIVERLQTKQEALLNNQKLKIYYKRITYHPSNESNQNEGNINNTTNNINNIKSPNVSRHTSAASNIGIGGNISTGSDLSIITNKNNKNININDNINLNLGLSQHSNIQQQNNIINSTTDPQQMKNQELTGDGIALLSIQNEEYLQNSETYLQHIESLVHSQDIIPRVCNMAMHKVAGLSVLAVLFAVIPVVIRAATD